MTIHLTLPLSQNPPLTAEPVISVYTDDDAIEDGFKTEHPIRPSPAGASSSAAYS
jgi:hypothetical protein